MAGQPGDRFGYLHYPVDTNTILWGLVIGAAALAATGASTAALRSMRHIGTTAALTVALVGAYAAYELVLFAATPFLGGGESFTAAIVGRLGLLSALWTIGLIAACEIARALNSTLGRQAASRR